MACFVVLSAPAHAKPREAFEGIWARTEAECRDEEGPNSRTLIDLQDRKTGPLFDQYENHCRIGQVARQGEAVRLRLTCHEFWELFTKRREGRATSAVLRVRGPQALEINGQAYRRCLQ